MDLKKNKEGLDTKLVNSYLPVFNGFYETLFTPNEDKTIENPYTFEDYTFDYQKYYDSVIKGSCEIIEEQLKEFKIKVKFEELIQPRFYNFQNDSINVIYTLDSKSIDLIFDFLIENIEDFETYLENNYTSGNGFLSSYSNKVSTWLKLLIKNENLEHILGSVFEFIITLNEYDDKDLYNDLSCEGYLEICGKLKQDYEKR